MEIQKLAPKNKNDGKFNKPTKEYEWGFGINQKYSGNPIKRLFWKQSPEKPPIHHKKCQNFSHPNLHYPREGRENPNNPLTKDEKSRSDNGCVQEESRIPSGAKVTEKNGVKQAYF